MAKQHCIHGEENCNRCAMNGVEVPTIHLSVILDVSPSMTDKWDQTLSGLNEYMSSLRQDQQENGQDYRVTMTTFSNRVDKVYDSVVLDVIPTFTKKNLRPDGSGTALYKAIVETVTPINTADPVLVVIITDGEDNQSTRTQELDANKILEDRQKLGNYTYAYLGVAKEAWGNAAHLGTAVASSMSNTTAQAYCAAMYDGSSKGLAGSTLRYSNLMRSNAASRRVGVSNVSMSVTNLFDDTPQTVVAVPDEDSNT